MVNLDARYDKEDVLSAIKDKVVTEQELWMAHWDESLWYAIVSC